MLQIDKITSNQSATFTQEAYDKMMEVIERLIERMTQLDVDLTIDDNWFTGLFNSLEKLGEQSQAR